MWKLYREKQKGGVTRFVIKRWNGAQPIRLPTNKYELIRNNEEELKKLVLRLNNTLPKGQRVRELIAINHAFISPDLLEEYRQLLLIQVPTRDRALTEFYYLVTYFLNFFINDMRLANPLEWHIHHKTVWAQYLASKKVPKSASAKKTIVSAANRFMIFLHEKRPTEVPPLKFVPLTKAKYKELEARRKMSGDARQRKYIPDSDVQTIRKNLTDELMPFFELALNYGLRRSETLGLKPEDVRRGYLSLERQLVAYKPLNVVYGPLKGREYRKVPHWTCAPHDAIQWILSSYKQRVHPDTLSDRWALFMRTLRLEYDFHDLRHTWITNMIRKHNPRDVQMGAGHKNLQTTMGYLHDDRNMDDEVYEPKKAS